MTAPAASCIVFALSMTTLAESLGLNPEKKLDLLEAVAELDAIILDDNISVKELFTKMLETHAYRRSVYTRLINGTLPPAVECKIIDHVAGKPVDRIEFEDKTKSVDHLTLQELHARHEQTITAMQKIIAAQNVEARQH